MGLLFLGFDWRGGTVMGGVSVGGFGGLFLGIWSERCKQETFYKKIINFKNSHNFWF